MTELLVGLWWPAAVVVVAVLAFRAFGRWVAHRERDFTQRPVAALEAKVAALENQLASLAMRR